MDDKDDRPSPEDELAFLWRAYGADDVDPFELTQEALEVRLMLRYLVYSIDYSKTFEEFCFEEGKKHGNR